MRLATSESTFNGCNYLFQDEFLHAPVGGRFFIQTRYRPWNTDCIPKASYLFIPNLICAPCFARAARALGFRLRRLAQHVQFKRQSLRLTDQFNQD